MPRSEINMAPFANEDVGAPEVETATGASSSIEAFDRAVRLYHELDDLLAELTDLKSEENDSYEMYAAPMTETDELLVQPDVSAWSRSYRENLETLVVERYDEINELTHRLWADTMLSIDTVVAVNALILAYHRPWDRFCEDGWAATNYRITKKWLRQTPVRDGDTAATAFRAKVHYLIDRPFTLEERLRA